MGARFVHQNQDNVDTNVRAYWMSNLINRWLGVRLDFIGALILLAVSLLCIGLRNSINAGFVGLVLGYSLSLTMMINWLVRMSIDTEMQLNSVEVRP